MSDRWEQRRVHAQRRQNVLESALLFVEAPGDGAGEYHVLERAVRSLRQWEAESAERRRRSAYDGVMAKYNERRKAGKCVRCGRRKAVPGISTCQLHRDSSVTGPPKAPKPRWPPRLVDETGARLNHCRGCGEAGHNRKSCPNPRLLAPTEGASP